jgi:hypothetical protein
LLKQLSTINPSKSDLTVNLGSLVETNHGTFYLSIGMGSVTYKNKAYYLISMAAPLAHLLKDRVKEAVFEFRGKTYEIIKIE